MYVSWSKNLLWPIFRGNIISSWRSPLSFIVSSLHCSPGSCISSTPRGTAPAASRTRCWECSWLQRTWWWRGRSLSKQSSCGEKLSTNCFSPQDTGRLPVRRRWRRVEDSVPSVRTTTTSPPCSTANTSSVRSAWQHGLTETRPAPCVGESERKKKIYV